MRRIVTLALFATALVAQSKPTAKPQSPGDLGALLDSFCKPLVDAGVAQGLVAGVIDGDRSEWRGYGSARLDVGGAPGANTLFDIGSISKVFTGVLLAGACKRGEVALDDLAQKWMPEGKSLPKTEANQIRLIDLATHMSGLPRLPDGMDPRGEDPYAAFTRERFYDSACASLLRNEPGSTYEYSNLGPSLLALMLVDRAGAASYEALLRDRVLAPLRLERTKVGGAEPDAELASGCDADLTPVKPWNLSAFAGAGGIRSTIVDMMAFARAQWAPPDDAALASALAFARDKQRELPGGAGIGLGWHIAKDNTTRWHNGQTAGFHAALFVRTEERRAVCILANTATDAIDAVAERLIQRLAGMEVKPIPFEAPIEVAPTALARFVGVYELKPGIACAITQRGAFLWAQLTGQPAFRILPRKETEFFYRAVQATIRFQLDGTEVTGLELDQGGRRLMWKKLPQAR